MNDTQVFIAALIGAGLLASGAFLRRAVSRLHYRDVPNFWRKLSPLLCVAAVAAGLALFSFSPAGTDAALWSGALLTAVTVAGSYGVSLQPQRVLSWRASRH